jgi:hypothetical protein
VVKLLHAHKAACTDRAMDEAVLGRHMDMVQWLHANRPEGCSGGAFDFAAHNGDIPTLKWLLLRYPGVGCTNLGLLFTAEKGDLATAKWLHKHGLAVFHHQTTVTAARYGHLNFIKWLHEVAGTYFTHEVADKAAEAGHLDVVKWLYKNRDEKYNPDALVAAASNGHLDVVKWLHDAGHAHKMDRAMYVAFKCGHLDVIKYLYSRYKNRKPFIWYFDVKDHKDIYDWMGTLVNIDLCARLGEFDEIKRLHENPDAQCTTNAMDWAAKYGRLDIVKWLHENRTEGCTKCAILFAAENGHLDTVKWLHENYNDIECPREALDLAAANGHVDVITWLHKTLGLRGICPTGEACSANDPVKVLDCLHSLGLAGSERGVINAIENCDRADVYEWFRKTKIITYP